MTSFRKILEHIYETSQDLGLLNLLLAFEDNELNQIISIVKKVHIRNEDIILTAKSVGDEPDNSKPIKSLENTDSDDTDEEVTIHERFYPNREPQKGVEIREPKIEHIPMDYEPEGPSQNPKGDRKRHVGDKNHIPLPMQEIEPDYLLHKPKKTQTDVKILDLDCVLDPEKVIEDWYNSLMISMIINKEIIRSETNSWNYVIASTRENVKAFLKTFTFETKNAIWQEIRGDITQFIKRIVEQIYKPFTGQTYEIFKKTRSTIEEADTMNHLEKISICDMCYFEEFTCEYSKYYYICPNEYWKSLTKKFMRKLPEPFNNEVMIIFNEAIEKQEASKENYKVNLQIDHSLGLAIIITRNLLAEKCKEGYLVRSSKVAVAKNPRICCSQYLDRIPGQYGCFSEKKRQTRRNQEERITDSKGTNNHTRRNSSRKRSTSKDTTKLLAKERKELKKTKKKFCPQKKKNCRCWLCNES
ncbi:CCHC-type domain-containing protein [Abeliophyllum distichum]|uniref:CCHC-type domain-containing protein n=1 Tax=Abeliophyllum distichum TaxID=126358 RepID=A0ABD1SAT3_9LAMI